MTLNVETGTRRATSEPAFHADDVDHVADYRTVSALAIVSLLFGLASPLCLLSPLFLIIPLCGAALSILALIRIAASDGVLAGRWAAAAGLALCVASGIAAISRDVVTQYLRTAQAEAFGRQWLGTLVGGNTEETFRLTVEGAQPRMPTEPGAPAPATTPYDEFVNNSLIKKIAAAGADAAVDFRGTQEFEPQSRRQFLVRQRFAIAPRRSGSSGESPKPIEADLTLQRSRFSREPRSRWLVARYEPATANSE